MKIRENYGRTGDARTKMVYLEEGGDGDFISLFVHFGDEFLLGQARLNEYRHTF